MNISRRRSSEVRCQSLPTNNEIEVFDGDDLPLENLVTTSQYIFRYYEMSVVLKLRIDHDDEWTMVYDVTPAPSSARSPAPDRPRHIQTEKKTDAGDDDQVLTKLPNGQWACNHKCKNKAK